MVPPVIQIPESPLLTGAKAAVYLRLCPPDAEPDEVNKAVRCLNRLVQGGKINPVQPGRSYCYAKVELDRYIVAATADFEPQKNAQ